MSFEFAHRKLRKCLYIYLGETKDCGLGIFAAKPFKGGEVIMPDEDDDCYAHVLSYDELRRRGYGLENTIQVGPNAFKPPTGNPDDFTNHSRDPTTGVRLTGRGAVVVALRDIAAHGQLTYDYYSTYLGNPYETMRCSRGASNRRGVIGDFGTLPDVPRERHLALGVVGDFVREPPRYGDAAAE